MPFVLNRDTFGCVFDALDIDTSHEIVGVRLRNVSSILTLNGDRSVVKRALNVGDGGFIGSLSAFHEVAYSSPEA